MRQKKPLWIKEFWWRKQNRRIGYYYKPKGEISMVCNKQSGFAAGSPMPLPETGFMGEFPGARYPVGMGYVPTQPWETPYPLNTALMAGTIFPSLDYPFVMGRCGR